tara:strand:- start:1539 stop:2165 length:627 start_codon:yes stop_codon:yes gene_type:complete
MSRARNLADLLQGGTTVPTAKIPTLNATHMPNGSWIQLHTVSLGVAAAEIIFNNTYVNVTYDDYVMIGKSVIPSADGAEGLITTSTDNGSSNVTTNNGRTFTPISGSGGHGNEINLSQNYIHMATDLGNDANEGGSFIAWFYGLNNTSFKKFMNYRYTAKHMNQDYTWGGGANMETTSAINYLRFKFSTGNVAAGSRVALYGIKGSNH